MVELFEKCRPSVVTFTATWRQTRATSRPADGRPGRTTRVVTVERGSGFIVHRDGYFLTCSHGLKHGGRFEAHFSGGATHRAREIARDDALDLALLKIDAPGPFVPLPLGRSDDLMVGERAVVLGNPDAFGLSLGVGYVTGLGRSTKTDFSLLTDMIQTDAGINPGISGGPLVNVLGEVIGVATSQRRDADGLGFATPIDKVRSALGAMIDAQGRYGFVLGLTVAGDTPAKVTGVVAGSPAAAAGLRVGDVIVRVEKTPIRDGLDFHLALIGRKGGRKLPLTVRRDGRTVERTPTPGTVAPLEAEKVAGLAAGLSYEAYAGHWHVLPDFAPLKPVETGTMPTVALGRWAGKDSFALRFTGYVEAPSDGIYAFYSASDDGSRVYVGGRLVVDSDGLHGPVEKRGFVPLKAGLHALRVEYFEASGDEALAVAWEGPGLRKQPIAAKALRHKPPATKPAPATEPATRPAAGTE